MEDQQLDEMNKVTFENVDPQQQIKDMLKEALEPLQVSLKEMMAENARLRNELVEKEALQYAPGVPQHLRRDDPLVDPSRMSVARSVTISTRPVRDNPGDYRAAIDPGELVKHTKGHQLVPFDKRTNAD